MLDEGCSIAARLIEAISAPCEASGIEASVGASIGISQRSPSDQSFNDSFERADYALYDVKRTGRGRYGVFGDRHNRERSETVQLEQCLRTANIEEEFTVVYQPIIDSRDSKITSLEALVRWNSPTRGTISPAIFIPLAEKSGAIRNITRFVLKRVLLDSENLDHQHGLKINLSLTDLMNNEQVSDLCGMIEKSSIDPRRITFELTETAFASNFDAVTHSISKLRSLGCGIALDDFGIEYSGLRYVQKLSPDVIKIDKSFIDLIGSDSGSRCIVKTIVELARNIGAKTVAEGVEAESQAVILRHLGCDELQGYLFYKPITCESAVELTRGQQIENGTSDRTYSRA
jgi:predicted signal transduction protein with EAL and GGDEF domain